MSPLEAARALLIDDGGDLVDGHFRCRDCDAHVCHMLIRQAGDCEVTDRHGPLCMYGALPQIVAMLASGERLRARTRELQERHDKETSGLRKELAAMTRSRNTWRNTWWYRVIHSGDTMDIARRVADAASPLAQKYTADLERMFEHLEREREAVLNAAVPTSSEGTA